MSGYKALPEILNDALEEQVDERPGVDDEFKRGFRNAILLSLIVFWAPVIMLIAWLRATYGPWAAATAVTVLIVGGMAAVVWLCRTATKSQDQED